MRQLHHEDHLYIPRQDMLQHQDDYRSLPCSSLSANRRELQGIFAGYCVGFGLVSLPCLMGPESCDQGMPLRALVIPSCPHSSVAPLISVRILIVPPEAYEPSALYTIDVPPPVWSSMIIPYF